MARHISREELDPLTKKLEDKSEVILSREQLAKFLGVSINTVQRLVQEKQIPYVRVRGRLLFLKSVIIDWLRTKLEAPYGWKTCCLKRNE